MAYDRFYNPDRLDTYRPKPAYGMGDLEYEQAHQANRRANQAGAGSGPQLRQYGGAVAGGLAQKAVGGGLMKVLGKGLLGKVLGPMAAPLPGMAGAMIATALLGKLFGKKPKKHTAADYNAVTSQFTPDTYVPENSNDFRQESRRNYGG